MAQRDISDISGFGYTHNTCSRMHALLVCVGLCLFMRFVDSKKNIEYYQPLFHKTQEQ